jgi:hypothetical protein
MTGRYALALLGGAAWGMAGLLAFGPAVGRAAATTSSPQIHLSAQVASVGQLVQVTGSGWSPEGQTVQIELCGQDALNLSDDCDQSNQYFAAIRSGGIFYGALTVRLPPAPCPCVFFVTNAGGHSGDTAPITIPGAPTKAIPLKTPRKPLALFAHVSAPLSISPLFGGPKRVTLVLRVSNSSDITFSTLVLSVRVGRGDNPSGFVVGRVIGRLAVGASRVVHIPVTIQPFTFGHYTVRAEVITGNASVAVVAGTNSYPWGILVATLLFVQAILLVWRNVIRRHLARSAAPDESPPLTAEVSSLTPVEAIVGGPIAGTAEDFASDTGGSTQPNQGRRNE